MINSGTDSSEISREHITINEDYQLDQEGFTYAVLEVSSAFSFCQLDHLQSSRQAPQVGLSCHPFRRRSLQSSGSSQA
jgi:hypothetical protein